MSSAPTNLKILFEDNHLLVIDKPPLLPTMGVGPEDDSLVARARQYIKQKYNKPGKVYLGVVSRLDSFTSGVIVLARTSKTASRLTEQFRNRFAKKTYWAIVPDQLPSRSGELEDRLVKNESRRRMEVLSPGAAAVQGEKLARLRYSSLAQHAGLCLIEVELKTGRKHQIRVQLEHAGCPILGDKKYGSNLPFKKGIALHSRKLVIEHPTQKVLQSFQSDPPGWWNMGQFSLS